MSDNRIPTKIMLSEDEIPRTWLNVKAVMSEQHEPMLNPNTLKPLTLDDMTPLFCTECAKQELNAVDLEIPIPEDVRDFYKMYRPSSLVRAYALEKVLGTPAEIYYKFEGTNTSGSHKLNSAVAQAYYAKQQGITCLTTETGAGQWGTALSMACAYYKIHADVYMVKCSSQQKPYRKAVIGTYGASVIPSPSQTTEAGRKILAKYPETGGSLGCAISEAVEVALKTPNCRYALGSVLDHVLLHQSIIGCEAKLALDKYGVTPDMIIGCAGGGSNLGGLIAPYMIDKIKGKNDIDFLAVEPQSCPSLTRGRYAYDFGDTAQTIPLMKMYTLGSGFIPSSSHAGGLRYHGMNAIISKLYHDGYMRAISLPQTKVFEAAELFAKCEGILPAPESAHAISAAISEALSCKEQGKKKVILFGLTGTGYFDMSAYMAYDEHRMEDYYPTDEDLEKGFATIPNIPQNR